MSRISHLSSTDTLLVINDEDYRRWLQELKARYRQAQVKAAASVNSELLRYYFQLGADINARGDENRYGSSFYEILSHDLKIILPGAEGLSPSNLKYCRRFFLLYATQQTNRQQVVDESIFSVPWGHHLLILGRCDGDVHKALFYVHKTLENQWSRAMLINMIGEKGKSNGLYETQGKAISNFESALPKPDTDLAREILKDPYNLQFLHLQENYQEQDLQKALEQNIIQFLLELGNGFAFVGRQKIFEVEGDEFKADLLFYHLKLRRYVVVELKVVKFQPEFVSKLNFYCSCVNHLLKSLDDGDTIGLLICKEKNDVVARWTLEGNQQQPIGISTYRLADLLPSDEQIADRIQQTEAELARLRTLQNKN